MLEPRGVYFLHPIWQLIERRTHGIGLERNDVNIYYTKYINNFKRALQANEESIVQAVDNRLTPGTDLV